MTMLGMQADSHYFPSYFSTREVNLNASCSVWPSINFNGNLPPQFTDPYLAYKEKFKQIMIQHEAIFKSQVHELHRLYNRQRELMVKMKRIEFDGQQVKLENSTSNQIFPETSFEYKNKSCIVSPNGQTGKESELLESKYIKVGKKILDLELPAYEYIDSEPEEEESLAPEIPSYRVKSLVENLQKNDVEPCLDDASFSERTKLFVDINEPVNLEEETDHEYKEVNSQLDHPLSSPKVIIKLEKNEDQQECPKDNDEAEDDDDDTERVCKISPSYLLDLNDGNLLTKRKYESGCSSLRKQARALAGTRMIVQALACFKRDVPSQRSHCYGGDNSCPAIINLDDENQKHIKGGGPMDVVMLTRDIDLNSISPCYYSPDGVANSFSLADGEKKLDFDCNLVPHSDFIDLDSVSRPDKKSSGSKFDFDLNSYFNEDEFFPLPSPLTEVDCAPENKERSPPRGDLDENQLDIPEEDLVDIPCELSMPENGKTEENLVEIPCEISMPENGKTEENLVEIPCEISLPENGKTEENLVEIPCELSMPEKGKPEMALVDIPSELSTPENGKREGDLVDIPCEVSIPENRKPEEDLVDIPCEVSMPENGKPEEDLVDIPCELSMPENGKTEEDLLTMAAEAIISISSSEVQNNSTKALKGDSLYWFAKLASSVVDDPESEFGVCIKNLHDHNKLSTDEVDYFEAMTLQLEETNPEGYYHNNKSSSLQEEATCLHSCPKRGRTRREKRQKLKDFQSEILPSLASLSRYEVSKDLQAIRGGLTGTNGWTKGRRGRPSKAETETKRPKSPGLDQKRGGYGECSVEDRNLIDWGKITRRRRGQRCLANNNPRLIVSQV